MVQFNNLTAQWHEIKDAALPRINKMLNLQHLLMDQKFKRLKKTLQNGMETNIV